MRCGFAALIGVTALLIAVPTFGQGGGGLAEQGSPATHGHDAHDHGTHGGVSAAGRPALAGTKVSRTIDVSMTDDMRFTPDTFEVRAGETVRFFVRNEGKLDHEFVIGTMENLKEHAEEMKKQPDMVHSGHGSITLKSGQRGAVVWTFGKSGTFKIACTLPGHFDRGMIGTLNVH